MRFEKLEGIGNDYIFLDCTQGGPEGLAELAVRMSDRHYGVGSDGLICVFPGWTGDFRMEMYNADGSRGAMCGNGIRCLGKFVYELGLTRKTCLAIDTDAGRRELRLHQRNGQVEEVTVFMGRPELLGTCEAEGYEAELVSVGNRHGVVFVPAPEAVELEREGPLLERALGGDEGINVEFVGIQGDGGLALRVWERGSGVTLGCGTGACAAYAAAVRRGLSSRAGCLAQLPGGALKLRWERGGEVEMTGPARRVFRGEWPQAR